MEQNSNLEKEIKETIEQMSPKGSLFESIHYFSDSQLNEFYINMNKEQAIYCLIEATKAGFRRGSYNLEECEALSKALRVLGGQ
jgi:hypothetical protein